MVVASATEALPQRITSSGKSMEWIGGSLDPKSQRDTCPIAILHLRLKPIGQLINCDNKKVIRDSLGEYLVALEK